MADNEETQGLFTQLWNKINKILVPRNAVVDNTDENNVKVTLKNAKGNTSQTRESLVSFTVPIPESAPPHILSTSNSPLAASTIVPDDTIMYIGTGNEDKTDIYYRKEPEHNFKTIVAVDVDAAPIHNVEIGDADPTEGLYDWISNKANVTDIIQYEKIYKIVDGTYEQIDYIQCSKSNPYTVGYYLPIDKTIRNGVDQSYEIIVSESDITNEWKINELRTIYGLKDIKITNDTLLYINSDNDDKTDIYYWKNNIKEWIDVFAFEDTGWNQGELLTLNEFLNHEQYAPFRELDSYDEYIQSITPEDYQVFIIPRSHEDYPLSNDIPYRFYYHNEYADHLEIIDAQDKKAWVGLLTNNLWIGNDLVKPFIGLFCIAQNTIESLPDLDGCIVQKSTYSGFKKLTLKDIDAIDEWQRVSFDSSHMDNANNYISLEKSCIWKNDKLQLLKIHMFIQYNTLPVLNKNNYIELNDNSLLPNYWSSSNLNYKYDDVNLPNDQGYSIGMAMVYTSQIHFLNIYYCESSNNKPCLTFTESRSNVNDFWFDAIIPYKMIGIE